MSEPAPTKRLFIKTYGCQMNVYDSERMADVLAPLGYAMTDAPEGADLVVLNTCHIREKATEKVYSELGKLKEMREERLAEGGPRMTIAVAGCVAQAEGEEIMRRQPAVDLVVGPQAYHQLPELIARTHRARGERLSADFAPEDKFDALAPTGRAGRPASPPSSPCRRAATSSAPSAWCPTRAAASGRGRPKTIEAEARDLAAQGVREVTLLGQNVNAYAGEGGLAALVRRLAAIEGLDRIRYTTSHPRDMDEALIAAHGEVAALMPYLHLPVQSGLRPHPEGHEPGAHGRELCAADREDPRRPARHRHLRRLHRGLPRRAGERLRGDAEPGARGRTTPPPSASNIPAAPARRPRPCRARWTRR